MNIIYFLIPITLALLFIAVCFFFGLFRMINLKTQIVQQNISF